MMLYVPTGLTDVNPDWVMALVSHMHHQPQVIQMDIHPQPNCEGVLSDICKVFVLVKVDDKRTVVHNLFIKIIPHQFRSIVTKHRLFDKEIAFYSQVIPTLFRFLAASENVKLKHFHVPHYIYGDITPSGEGVLVLEDVSAKGFDTFDTTINLMDINRLTATVLALAEFHGLCMAFDASSQQKLIELFPAFAPSHLMWVQEDMLHFLSGVSQSAEKFLQSHGEQELWAKFAHTMRDPMALFEREFSRASRWKCFQHGDSWHNNFLFHKSRHKEHVYVVDWQVAFMGHACTDLCYLIYSSSTLAMRHKYLDHLLRMYYETLTNLMHDLGASTPSTFDEFYREFVQSLPFCLLFCANKDEFEPDHGSSLPEVATDEEMTLLEESTTSKVKVINDKKLLKAVRRRNFLDICREAVLYKVLYN